MPRPEVLLAKIRAFRSFLSEKIADISYRVIWRLDSFIRFFGGAIFYDFDIHENDEYIPNPFLYLWCLVSTLFFNYSTCIRYIASWFCSTPESERAIHDMASVIGGPKEFHLVCLTIWSVHNAVISVTWYKTLSKGDTVVLEPLLALKCASVARKYKLTPVMLSRLRFRHKLAVLCVFGLVLWGICCGFVFSSVLWYLEHGNDVFRPWSIVMIVMTAAWAANVSWYVYYSFALFHLTCYMFGLRLKSFQMSLNYLVRKARRYKKRVRDVAIKSRLDEYAELCRMVERYNCFWKSFLGIAYYFYVFIVAILVFVVLFAPIPDISKKMWFVIMVAQASCIAILAYSGDIVSRKVYKPYVQFISLQALTSSNSKVKCQLLAAIEMSAGNFIANTLHSKTSGRMVGFSVFDQFVITDNDYINISIALSTFLMLFLENYLF